MYIIAVIIIFVDVYLPQLLDVRVARREPAGGGDRGALELLSLSLYFI